MVLPPLGVARHGPGEFVPTLMILTRRWYGVTGDFPGVHGGQRGLGGDLVPTLMILTRSWYGVTGDFPPGVHDGQRGQCGDLVPTLMSTVILTTHWHRWHGPGVVVLTRQSPGDLGGVVVVLTLLGVMILTRHGAFVLTLRGLGDLGSTSRGVMILTRYGLTRILNRDCQWLCLDWVVMPTQH